MKTEPALIIGTIVTIILAVIQALAGNGFVGTALAGQLTDVVNSGASLIYLLIPLITGLIVRQAVYSPASFEAK